MKKLFVCKSKRLAGFLVSHGCECIKVDTDKLEILKRVKCLLEDYGYEVELEKEVALHFGDYTLKLTRHRPQKK